MSITINYGTEIFNMVTVPCSCEGHDEDCYFCKGEGEYSENSLEMNVSNGNFSHLMGVLGIDTGDDYCGGLVPIAVVNAVDSYIPGLGVREPQEDTSGNCTIISCGVDEDYMARRLVQLREIAQAYIDKGKGDSFIPWG